ncbi:MAG: TIGR00725 family protein [Deltaproteobacteria bacterium]|nr:TIGR00725 family protein [Deltaproteobacteria bacterium]
MNIPKNRQVAVVGSSDVDYGSAALATEVGRTVAAVGAVLICGGLGGTMEAAARGAKERGGITVGIVPSYQKDTANPYIDIIIPSGLGHARNALVAASGDLVVALPGSHGTRSEVSLALKMGRPVIGVTAWSDIPQVKVVNSAQELERELCLVFRHPITI